MQELTYEDIALLDQDEDFQQVVIQSEEESYWKHSGLRRLKDYIPGGIYVHDRAAVPEGWDIDRDYHSLSKVLKKNGNEIMTPVSSVPIVITGRTTNITTGTEGFEISWFQDGHWKKINGSREMFMMQNKIQEFAKYGFPVSSVNAKHIINYLTDFDSINRGFIPALTVSEQIGWQKKGFLLGDIYINGKGEETTEIRFQGADLGENQLIDSIHVNGTLEGCIESIKRVQPYHRVLVGVYASVSSVLLDVLKGKRFFYEWACETSKGKSISMMLAASMWGDPNEGDGLIKSWNTTLNAVERTAAAFKNIPVFLDDTKKQKNKTLLSTCVYQLQDGQSKNRATIAGLGIQKSWNNIVFSTGEQKLINYSQDGGAVARGIFLENLPFGAANEETYEVVTDLEFNVREHYGHVGKEFISYVIRNKNRWSEWRQEYSEAKKMYVKMCEGMNSVVSRLADYIATIHVGAKLLHECLGLDWNHGEPVMKVWLEMISENVDVDKPLEAIKTVYSWASANRNRFKKDDFSTAERFGHWDTEGFWKQIIIYPDPLEEFLAKKGYEPQAILKSWDDRGWLETSKNRKHKKFINRKDLCGDFVVIKKEALEQ